MRKAQRRAMLQLKKKRKKEENNKKRRIENRQVWPLLSSKQPLQRLYHFPHHKQPKERGRSASRESWVLSLTHREPAPSRLWWNDVLCSSPRHAKGCLWGIRNRELTALATATLGLVVDIDSGAASCVVFRAVDETLLNIGSQTVKGLVDIDVALR